MFPFLTGQKPCFYFMMMLIGSIRIVGQGKCRKCPLISTEFSVLTSRLRPAQQNRICVALDTMSCSLDNKDDCYSSNERNRVLVLNFKVCFHHSNIDFGNEIPFKF